jgi:hypothetical protein
MELFWQANLKDADTIFRQALTSRIITAMLDHVRIGCDRV